MVYLFLADGFEEIEALATVDILRRGEVDITTVSMNEDCRVMSSHGIAVCADTLFADADYTDAEMLILPGGSTKLNEYDCLKALLKEHNAKGGKIAAICAAPMVLGGIGLLQGRKATCYPGFEQYMDGAEYTAQLVTADGNITTGRGPAATLPFAYTLLADLKGQRVSKAVQDGMIFTQLMQEGRQ